LNPLLVCSKSTRKFLPGYDRVRVVTSAPTKDILDEVGTEEDVIAIGGGAVIDTAKILSKNPIRCYPTTAAGSSSTSWSVYWDGTTKCSLKRMMPKDVILNGLFVEELSEDVIMSTTCDVVSHCLDSMSSIKATKESIEYCEEALKILRNEKDNFGLIKAGDMAGKAIEIAGTNLLHSLSYPLTGYYDISHGMALGYLLPRLSKFMGYNVDDIIGNYKIEFEFDKKFVIDEAFKYDKIYEFNKIKNLDKETLYEKL
jgi:alcohol dehydrogenase class IV